MDVLTLLLSLWFAGPLAKLESRSWHEREAATAELRKAGPVAWPAIRAKMIATHSPESRWRCESLLPNEGYLVARWLLDHPEVFTAVCSWVDQNGTNCNGWKSEQWVRMLPYASGTIEGDVILMLRRASRSKPLPIPIAMPGP